MKRLLYATLIFTTTLLAAPHAAKDLVLIPTEDSVSINWKSDFSDETGYKIYRDGALIYTTMAKERQFIDKGLTPHTTYTYEVVATDDAITKYLSVAKVNDVDEPIVAYLSNMSDNDKDWVGVFHDQRTTQDKGIDRAHLLAWTYTQVHESGEGAVVVDSIFSGSLPEGDYELRVFSNDSYTTIDKAYFSISQEKHLSFLEPAFEENTPVNVRLHAIAGNDEDWVGLYKKGDNNAWAKVQTWKFTEGLQEGSIMIDGLDAGEYEARLFYNNSFILEDKERFVVHKPIQTQTIAVADHQMNITLIYQMSPQPQPVIYFTTGGASATDGYRPLLDRLVKEGYLVISANETQWRYDSDLADDFYAAMMVGRDSANAINGVSLDDTNVGLVGHSSGAGVLPSLGYRLFDVGGYGSHGGFIFGATPWYDPSYVAGQSIPSDINFVTQWYIDDDSTHPNHYLEMFHFITADNKAFLTAKTSKTAGTANYVSMNIGGMEDSIGLTHFVLEADPKVVENAVVREGIHKPLIDLAHYTFTKQDKGAIFKTTTYEDDYLKILPNQALPSPSTYNNMINAYINWGGNHYGCEGPREQACSDFTIPVQ